MSRAGWTRLLGRVLAVVLVATALTWVLGHREGQVTSVLATVRTRSVDVGVDYPGTVTGVLVEPDQDVTAGDPVLEVTSLRLAYDIAQGLLPASTAAYEISDDGTVTVLAPATGTLTSLTVAQGQYVPGGQVLATIEEAGTAQVEALFHIDPSDLTRLAVGAPVTVALPDRKQYEGTVDTFSVANADADAVVTATVVAPGLTHADGVLTQAGTPVVASVRLAPQGPLSSVYEALDGFRQKVAGL